MIFKDFKRSLRHSNEWFGLIDKKIYYKVYQSVIESLLSRPESAVRLAVLADDLDNCLGWSLSESKKLHYVYVKEDFRNIGIAKSLLPKEFDQITHLTKAGQSIWQSKFPNVIFNPF